MTIINDRTYSSRQGADRAARAYFKDHGIVAKAGTHFRITAEGARFRWEPMAAFESPDDPTPDGVASEMPFPEVEADPAPEDDAITEAELLGAAEAVDGFDQSGEAQTVEEAQAAERDARENAAPLPRKQTIREMVLERKKRDAEAAIVAAAAAQQKVRAETSQPGNWEVRLVDLIGTPAEKLAQEVRDGAAAAAVGDPDDIPACLKREKVAAAVVSGPAEPKRPEIVWPDDKPSEPKARNGKRSDTRAYLIAAAALAAAERGELPTPPDFSAPTHRAYRKRLALLVEAASKGDLMFLKADTTEPLSGSRKMLCAYRALAIVALEARSSRAAA